MFNKKLLLVLVVVSVIVLTCLAYFTFGFFVSAALLDHPVVAHQEYHRIYDWDLSRHTYNKDLDGDGLNDFVSLTGCAFLSRLYQGISPEKRCTAPGISALSQTSPQIGEKFITTTTSVLDLSFRDTSSERPRYAFMYKNNDIWRIVSNNAIETAAFEITPTGLVKKSINVRERMQVWLYFFSSYSVVGYHFIYFLVR